MRPEFEVKLTKEKAKQFLSDKNVKYALTKLRNRTKGRKNLTLDESSLPEVIKLSNSEKTLSITTVMFLNMSSDSIDDYIDKLLTML